MSLDKATLIGWVLITAGWVTTHILSLRAQRKNFHNEILDRARREITEDIRSAQTWFINVGTQISMGHIHASMEEKGFPANWPQVIANLWNLAYVDDSEWRWNRRLEDFLILFPELKAFREEQQIEQQNVCTRIQKLTSDLHGTMPFASVTQLYVDTADGKEKRKKMFDDPTLRQLEDDVSTRTAVMEDLRVWIQNRVLGPITKTELEMRRPNNPRLPYLKVSKKGFLFWKRYQLEITTDDTRIFKL